jgi:NTE family protein
LVLSGGGARGAYEAGVLCFLLEQLAPRLGSSVQPDIIVGTSVGAIHACYLAGTAHMQRERARRLRQTWLKLRFEDLFRVTARDALKVPLRIASLLRVPAELRGNGLPEKLYGLLDTSRLERVVMSAIPWRSIRKNLVEGRVRALCVAATQISTGRVVIFVQGGVSIGPAHALASAAIPVLFPPVRVGGTYYADGGLRMNTPLAPAVHLGADRVLVVGLRSRVPTGEEARAAERRVQGLGNPLFLYGKVLNSVLLDQLDSDLGQLRHINEVLRSGEKAFGDEFLSEINQAAGRQREGEGYRVIEDLVVRPSRDLGEVAGEVLGGERPSRPICSRTSSSTTTTPRPCSSWATRTLATSRSSSPPSSATRPSDGLRAGPAAVASLLTWRRSPRLPRSAGWRYGLAGGRDRALRSAGGHHEGSGPA